MKTKVMKKQKSIVQKAPPMTTAETEQLDMLMLALPKYSECDIHPELYEKALKSRRYIKENPEYAITGLWYLTGLTWEGAPQLLIRLSQKTDKENYDEILKSLQLNSDLFDIFCQDVIYNFDEEILGGDKMLCGIQKVFSMKFIAEDFSQYSILTGR